MLKKEQRNCYYYLFVPIFFSLFLSFHFTANSLTCYKCNSTSIRDFACKDPFYSNRVHKRKCPENEICAKIVGRINGITSFIRDCYKNDDSFKYTSRIPYYDQVAFDAKIYFCKKDLCNTSQKLTNYPLILYLSIFGSYFLKKVTN